MDPYTNVDEIWIALGKFGKFQITQLLVSWIAILSLCFQLLNVVFIGKTFFNKNTLTFYFLIKKKSIRSNQLSIKNNHETFQYFRSQDTDRPFSVHQ